MPKRMLNPYTAHVGDLKPGTVMAVTVTCHITQDLSGEKRVRYRMYRCPFPSTPMTESDDGVPQGMRVGDFEAETAFALFPVVHMAEGAPDNF